MVIGHDEQIQYLKKLAQKETLGHAYLFFGPERVGKRTVGVHFSNFLETGEFEDPTFLGDALFVRPDEKKTIGIDAARDIKNFLSQRPNRSRYRTVVVDDAECLTTEAQNALLKISEDPPRSGLIILVMRDSEAIRATLRSRFQKIYFGAVPTKTIANWLQKKEDYKATEAAHAASESFGLPGLALALLSDKKLKSLYKKAKEFLSLSSGGQGRDFVKKLIEVEGFNLEEFLDALIIQKYAQDRGVLNAKPTFFLRRLLLLRREAAFVNVNPRLQLEALLTSR